MFLLLVAQSNYLPHLPLAELSLAVLGGFSVLLMALCKSLLPVHNSSNRDWIQTSIYLRNQINIIKVVPIISAAKKVTKEPDEGLN